MLAWASGKPVQCLCIWHTFVLRAGGFQDEDVYPEALRWFASGSGPHATYIDVEDSQLYQEQVSIIAWHGPMHIGSSTHIMLATATLIC